MVIFFTALLLISVLGMVSLLAIKRRELTTGRIFWASVRPGVGAFFHHKLAWLEYVLPGLIRVFIHNVYAGARRLLHLAGAWVVVKLEHGLEKALHAVRHTTAAPPRSGQETSAFLREVAEHKKKLQDDNPDRGIVEE